MGWMERLSRWRPADEAAPLLAQAILVFIMVGMGACALMLFSL